MKGRGENKNYNSEITIIKKEMKGRESLRTGSRENSDLEGRHKVPSPRARILECIQPL